MSARVYSLCEGHRGARRRAPLVRNCAACAHEAGCRQLADQWGTSAMACRRATRDECFRAKGLVMLRTCTCCGVETYMPYCHGCGAAANATADLPALSGNVRRDVVQGVDHG